LTISPFYREECESQIKGYPKALHKKFRTQAEAEAYVKFGDAASTAAAAAPVPTISSAKSENITLTKHSPKKSYMKRKTGTEPAKIVDETGWDVVYTDGACQGNGKQAAVAGIGVWWGNGDQRWAIPFRLTRLLDSFLEEIYPSDAQGIKRIIELKLS